MKTTLGSNAKTKIKQALGLFVLAAAFGAQAATYTYDAGATTSPGVLWSDGNNWVGDTVPTFNNQADLVFDTTITAAAMRIGSARTVRSMFFGDNLYGNPTFNFIRVDTVDNGNSGTPALTLQADSGNATVTQASGFQQDYLQLGISTGGNVVLGSSLDLNVNSATKPVLFDSIVSGSGALNKYGVGTAQLYRANTFSGGVNIFEGTVEAYNNSAALGTGAVALGEASGAANATLRVGNTLTLTNAMTVNTGSGSRTIANDATRAGNSVLSGNITLNKDATFNIALVTGGSHDRMILSGAVGGTGGIVKTNNGILILSGTGNNYSGATDIQAGKLYLSGAGRLGSGNVTIASGANLDFAAGNADTPNVVANNISGSGLILQNGANTRTALTGDVTNTGGLTINGGTFLIGNGGTTGSYTGDTTVNTGAVLAFARSNAYTHGGTISGAGGVTKVSPGDVTLTGNNSYTGLTHLFTGVLVADHANALGTGGNITFNSAGGNTGTIRYTAASAGTDWATRMKGSTGTIRLDTNGNDVNLAGSIDSTNTAGLVKSGAGTLTLGGVNTYTGATTVGAGGLIVGGSLASGSAVTVASGALIGGDGTIGGSLTLNNGAFLVFDPTLSLPLTVSGTFTLNSSFGVASLRNSSGGEIDWSLVANNPDGYTLLDGVDLPIFSADNISNYGAGNAFDIGGGRSAYFENGSLALVVIPEPASLGLLVAGVAGLMALRRMTRS